MAIGKPKDISGKRVDKKNLLTQVPIQPDTAPVQVQAPPPTPLPPAQQKIIAPQIIRNQDTGKVTGVKLPDGTTFMGSQKDIRQIAETASRKLQAPAGTIEATGVAQQQNELQRQQEQTQVGIQLAQQVGQPTAVAQQQVQPSEVDVKQLLGSAGGGVLPGAVTGAGASLLGAGGVAGTVALTPVALGALTVALTSARSNLKAQRQGEITAGGEALPDGVRNLRTFISGANANPALADTYLQQFNEQLDYIDLAESKLKLDAHSNVNKFVGVDGTPQLADFNRYRTEGLRANLILQMQVALATPDPAKGLQQPIEGF